MPEGTCSARLLTWLSLGSARPSVQRVEGCKEQMAHTAKEPHSLPRACPAMRRSTSSSLTTRSRRKTPDPIGHATRSTTGIAAPCSVAWTTSGAALANSSTLKTAQLLVNSRGMKTVQGKGGKMQFASSIGAALTAGWKRTTAGSACIGGDVSQNPDVEATPLVLLAQGLPS